MSGTQPFAPAQPGMGVARSIRIEGTQRVDPQTVRSYLTIREGDPMTPSRLDESLKALFATGYFADVALNPEGDVLVVRVSENPVINRVAFEGNRRIEDDTLRGEVQSRPRIVYTRTRVQNDVKRILDLYRRGGRFAARVEPKIIQLEQNRVDLVFEIEEGDRTKVERINFVGNQRFSDSRLRSEIRTEESRWWKILTSDDVYDPDRLAFDRELLRKFYLEEGYADFRVVAAVAELTPDRSAFVITFTVEEGERYRFGSVDATSQLPDLSADQVRPLIAIREGSWYNATQVEQTVEKLNEEIGKFGYAFVDVRPRVQRQREERLIDVVFEIGEGPRVYVDRIEIEGNVRTLDKVIRREFRLLEGDAFNTQKLRLSRQRIANLGFFERAEVTNVPGSQPDRTTIKVNIQERSTGEISLGAGFSSTQGALADVALRERNLLGRGQDLRLGFQIAERQQQIDLSFTEPYFLDRPLLAGGDIFRIVRDNTDESSFDLDTAGASLRMGYRITEPLSQRWTYTFRRDKIDPQSGASDFIRKEGGTSYTSSIRQDLVYDTRDNRFEPTEGYTLSLTTEVAGLGGTVRFFRSEVSASWYYSLVDEVVLGLGGRAGYIVGLGDDVRLNDRFFKGGESLRGFSVSGIGPRDRTTGDALGGNRYTTASAEVTFPLGLPDELGLKGRVFTDVGTLGGIDDSDPRIQDRESVRMSAGVGLTWRSPFGPIRLDYAEPILKENFDSVSKFLFSFGTRF
ncbi:MAG: outer membrane protein assembly factor BamA [Alphaproteobacteria bacterium]